MEINYITFGRELCRAAIMEALPGVACMASVAIHPAIPTIAQTAISFGSIKNAVSECRSLEPWTFSRFGSTLYRVGVSVLIGYQMVYQSPEGHLALGAIAASTGMIMLYRGFQQIKQGDQCSLARGLVTTFIGSFNIASGLGRIKSSLPDLVHEIRIWRQLPPHQHDRFAYDGVHLFSSTIEEGPGLGNSVDVKIAKSTFEALHASREPHVKFSEDKMLPWNPLGTCSSRALDFLARHLIQCPIDDASFGAQANCIAGFKELYEVDGSAFWARQAAFDTISVDTKSADPETLQTAKIASLAAFHHLKLVPMTTTAIKIPKDKYFHYPCLADDQVKEIYQRSYGLISKEDLYLKLCSRFNSKLKDSEKFLIDAVNKLPFGRHLIRGIIPEDNDKLEHHGHSMAMIKSKKGSFFFDPMYGAYSMLCDLGHYLLGKAKSSSHMVWYNETRIYQVTCKEGGCHNLK